MFYPLLPVIRPISWVLIKTEKEEKKDWIVNCFNQISIVYISTSLFFVTCLIQGEKKERTKKKKKMEEMNGVVGFGKKN